MASILFEKKVHPTLFNEVHASLCAWAKKNSEQTVHVTDILKHPADGSLSFLVSFPDSEDDVSRSGVNMVVAWVSMEHVTKRWLRARGQFMYT